MTTYIMNDLTTTTLKRSQYAAAKLPELKALAKLYDIKVVGEATYKPDWIDSLVLFMPKQVAIWDYGLNHNDSRHCLHEIKNGEDIFAAITTFSNPSTIERAIIGRLIELGCNWKDEVWYPGNQQPSEGFKRVYKNLLPSDIHFIDKIWSIYKIKKLINEVEFQLGKHWEANELNPEY